MKKIILSFLIAFISITGCSKEPMPEQPSVSKEQIPAYTDTAYVAIDNNVPHFENKTSIDPYLCLSELDSLGRTQFAEACLSIEMFPTEKRSDISSIHPSGWQSVRNESLPEGYLYNRCHLIAYSLCGSNDPQNLMTGTRYFNVEAMLPFEDMVRDYINETENHVLYRVTPLYEGDNLVADGVFMEAYSMEDHGEGISYNVFCYNVQPSVTIDYATGQASFLNEKKDGKKKYVLNTNTHKIHNPSCKGIKNMKSKNKKEVSATIQELEKQGYSKCGICLN